MSYFDLPALKNELKTYIKTKTLVDRSKKQEEKTKSGHPKWDFLELREAQQKIKLYRSKNQHCEAMCKRALHSPGALFI